MDSDVNPCVAMYSSSRQALKTFEDGFRCNPMYWDVLICLLLLKCLIPCMQGKWFSRHLLYLPKKFFVPTFSDELKNKYSCREVLETGMDLNIIKDFKPYCTFFTIIEISTQYVSCTISNSLGISVQKCQILNLNRMI